MVRVPARQVARLARAFQGARAGAAAGQNGALSVGVTLELGQPGSGAAASALQLVRGHAQPAVATRLEQQVAVIPEIQTDLFGAVSPVSNESVEEGVFKNVDGHRFDDGRYQAFQAEVQQFIGQERVFTDPVRTFAYGEPGGGASGAVHGPHAGAKRQQQRRARGRVGGWARTAAAAGCGM